MGQIQVVNHFLMIIIIKGFRTIVFILFVISATFRPLYPPAFFRCLSNLGTYIELRTMSFIKSTGVACSDSFSHNRVQVLSIPVLLLACSQDWTCNLQMIDSLEAQGTSIYNRYAMKTIVRQPLNDIGRNVVEITIKMKTIVQKPLMISAETLWK